MFWICSQPDVREERFEGGSSREIGQDGPQPVPGFGFAVLQLAIMLIRTAARLPASGLPTNSQFLRQIATDFIARSAALLSMFNAPFSVYRFRASH